MTPIEKCFGVAFCGESPDAVISGNNAYEGRRRSFDLRDGFDRLVVGDSIDVYVDAATPDQSRLRPAWKGSNLLNLGYAFMMLTPAMFLAMSFEPARRVLEHISGADGVPWRWGVCALGLFFVLTALSVQSEQVRAVPMMDRAEATLIDRQRDVLSPHVAFTTITYSLHLSRRSSRRYISHR